MLDLNLFEPSLDKIRYTKSAISYNKPFVSYNKSLNT
nr:MAG TPA: hypothetical protein [Microviridae sp.]